MRKGLGGPAVHRGKNGREQASPDCDACPARYLCGSGETEAIMATDSVTFAGCHELVTLPA